MRRNAVDFTKKDTGDFMLAVRKKYSLRQTDVADRLNISQSNYSKMENAILEPSARQWMVFCQLFGLSCDFLFTKTKV
jgi:transcriptional regulator with XRE-family HTH domain